MLCASERLEEGLYCGLSRLVVINSPCRDQIVGHQSSTVAVLSAVLDITVTDPQAGQCTICVSDCP